MVDIVNRFEVVLTTYSEVKDQHPTWSDVAVEDYMARLRDVVQVAEDTNKINDEIIAIKIAIAILEARVDAIELSIKDINQLIASIIGSLGKLHARMNNKDKEVKRINQLMAGD